MPATARSTHPTNNPMKPQLKSLALLALLCGVLGAASPVAQINITLAGPC